MTTQHPHSSVLPNDYNRDGTSLMLDHEYITIALVIP